MIAALLLQLAVPTEPSGGVATPTDVTALPRLPLLRRLPDLTPFSAFVRDEWRNRRCMIAPASSGTRQTLTVELAVSVSPDGRIRRILPRAIGCAAVEQYAAGLASRLIRRNVATPVEQVWYRFPVTFTWAA